jgi:hypothetical protein
MMSPITEVLQAFPGSIANAQMPLLSESNDHERCSETFNCKLPRFSCSLFNWRFAILFQRKLRKRVPSLKLTHPVVDRF